MNSSTSITATVPAGTTGDTVPVSVTTDAGTTAATNVTYTFVPSLVVTTTADDVTGNAGNCPRPDCSLRDALAAANTDGGAVITFDPTVFPTGPGATPQTITLGSSLTIASGVVSIVGPGANLLTVAGGGGLSDFSVFTVNSGAQVTLDGLTIANGYSAVEDGGGIHNSGTLAVTNSIIYGNVVQGSYAGAGIGNSGTLTVTNSTFNQNAGDYGGAISNSGTATVTNSTFSGSRSFTYAGGAIYASGGTLTLANDIFANGEIFDGATVGGVENAGGTVTDAGHNVFYNNAGGDSFGFTLSGTDVTGANTSLANLGYYGGSTETMPPLPGSSALNAGAYIAGEPTTDQRGALRPSTAGAVMDSGAVQISGDAPMIGAVTPNNGSVAGGTTVTITGTGFDLATSSGNSVSAVNFGSTAATSFQVNPATATAPGSITAVTPAASAAGTVDVTATNSAGTSATSSNDQFIYWNPVSISPAPATLNLSYGSYFSQTFTVDGGSGAYTLTNSGTLPAGLTLTPTSGSSGTSWTLSGIPTSGGNDTVQLTATDTAYPSNKTVESFSIDVAKATPAFSVTTTPPISFTYGNGGTIGVLLSASSSETGISDPNGTVTYAIDSGATQSASLTNGQAEFTIPASLAAGAHQITWSYGGDSNYSALANQTISFTVSAATLRITAGNGMMTYGGTVPPITPSYSGFVNSDTAASLSTPPTCSTEATPTSGVGSYASSCSGAVDADYAISYEPGTVNVNPAKLSVTVANASRAYGVANPAFSGTVTGLANNDTTSTVGLLYATMATSTSAPGSYRITAAITSTNYTLDLTPGTLTVTKAMPIIQWSMPGAISYGTALSAAQLDATATYNGTAVPGTFTYTLAAGTVLSAGTHTLSVNFTPTDTTDYATPAAVTTSITVNKDALTVTAANATRAYGAANPAFSGTVAGLANGDTTSTVGLLYATIATATSAPGSYPITATITSTNYTLNLTPGTLTVTKALPIIQWSMPEAISYGTALSAAQLDATATYNGTAVPGTFTYTLAAGTVLSAGTHTLSVNFTPTDTTDYATPAAVTTSITVNKDALTVTAANASRAYGAANPAFSGTVTGAENNDAFTASYSTTATTASDAGSYAIVPSVTSADLSDYAVTSINGTLTVTQAATATTLSANATSITPGQSLTLTANVADAATGSTGTPTGTVNFYDGATLLGTGTLSGGTATYTAASLAPGETHALTATYAGSIDFTGSTSSSAVSVPVAALDFSLNISGTQSQTVMPGGAASYSFQISPTYGSYPSQVSFSASGLPPSATATFSPSTIAAAGGTKTVTLTLQTAEPGALVKSSSPFGSGDAPLALGLLFFPLLSFRRVRRSLLGRATVMVLLLATGLAGIASLTGCGAGTGFNGQAVKNYTVTVTAASGSVRQSFDVNLNVQ